MPIYNDAIMSITIVDFYKRKFLLTKSKTVSTARLTNLQETGQHAMQLNSYL